MPKQQVTSREIALVLIVHIAACFVFVWAVRFLFDWFPNSNLFGFVLLILLLMALANAYYAVEILATNPQTRVGKIGKGVFIGSLVVLALTGIMAVGLWIIVRLHIKSHTLALVLSVIAPRAGTLVYVLAVLAAYAGCFWFIRKIAPLLK